MRSWKVGLSLILAGVLCIPTWAQANAQGIRQAAPPQPGMVNYVEGQASLGGQALTQNSAGATQLPLGQPLATQNGRAEILLNPGVLLRLDNNSAASMNSAAIENTEVTVSTGRAMIEADQILKDNFIAIHEGPGTVRLVKEGLYEFDALHGQVRVFDGRAEVSVAGKTFTVQGGHEFDLNASKLEGSRL